MTLEDEKAPHVSYRDRREAGSCNFCSRPHYMVFEIQRAQGGGLVVRLCRACRDSLRRFK